MRVFGFDLGFELAEVEFETAELERVEERSDHGDDPRGCGQQDEGDREGFEFTGLVLVGESDAGGGEEDRREFGAHRSSIMRQVPEKCEMRQFWPGF
jgi:hypothetical protein